ncbi:GntR family transcriptional regulator [Frankia sp. Hr75.2]|nr:GntR family transcriptional regulator [Frankia sp. Hr75.2]
MVISGHDPNRPKYQQLAAILRRKIQNGELSPGQQLPSEAELIAQYRTGRSTIRRAIGTLRNEGLLVSEQGRGVFVPSERPIVYEANKFGSRRVRLSSGTDSFTTLVEGQGIQKSHQVVTCEVIDADDEIASLLGLDGADTRVLARRRVMWVNDRPSMIGDSFYPLAFVENSRLPDPADIPEGDDQELEDVGHVAKLYHDLTTFRMPTPEEVSTLDIPPGTPVARTTRTSIEASGTHCEVYLTIIPGGSRYIFSHWIDND